MVKPSVHPCGEAVGEAVGDATWSAALLEAALVSGSLSAPGGLTPCSIGSAWRKDMLLRLRFDTRLPAEVIQGIPDPSGKKMQPMVVVSGGAQSPFCGVHRIVQCDDAGTTVLCFVAKFDGTFEPKPFDIDPPLRPGSTNLVIKPRLGQGGGTSGVSVDRLGVSAETVTIAPPLVFHTRMNIFHLDEINTVAQTFRADVYLEFRLRGISSEPEQDLVQTLFDAYGFREDMLELMMAVDVISTERWSAMTGSSTRPGTFDYTLKLRVKAILAEQYELESFPFDEQDLHITTTLNIPTIRATLTENLEFPSVMMHRTFQQKSVFDIVYDDVLGVEISESDPSESGAGFVYPRCTFCTTLGRHYGYYVTNVLLPMTMITYLAAVTAGAVDANGERMSTADRLSVTLTLMLTAVAYKFIVAASLPQVSYLTSLDTYILVCFLFMLLISVENVVWPASTAALAGVEPFDEIYIMLIYLGSFTLFNLAYVGRVWGKLAARRERQRQRRNEFEARRGSAKTK